MKILVIGDPHGKLPKGLTQIVKKNKIELIIVTGEIPPVPFEIFYPKSLLVKLSGNYDSSYSDNKYEQIVSKLNSFGLPVLVLLGSAYVTEGKKFALGLFKKHKNMIYKRVGRVKIKGKEFILFDMIWEKWAYKWLDKKFLKKVTKKDKTRINTLNKLLKETKDPILVTHCPPYGYLDKVPKVGHVGSKVVLGAIKKHQPKYVFCGHIHEGKGKKKIGKTTVINAGCCGDYVVLDV